MQFPSGFEHVVREREPLAQYTWLQIGGPARYFAEPNTGDELTGMIRAAFEAQISFRVLGGGSNLLIREAGVDGLVLSFAAPELSSIRIDGRRVTVGAGAKLSHLISRTVGAGLAGLEHLVGIPGTVGGAVAGNAGVINGDIGSRVRRVGCVTRHGELVQRDASSLQFSYRLGNLDDVAIHEVELELDAGNVVELTRRMQNSWIYKRSQQPPSDQRAAVAFVDPSGITAAELIDQVGLKGASLGEVSLSAQYPGFLIVSGGANSEQVLALLDRVRKAVEHRTGIQLQSHLRIW